MLKQKKISLEEKARLLRNDKNMKAIERSFTNKVNKELKWYYRKAAKFTAKQTLLINHLTDAHANNLQEIFRSEYKKIIARSVNYTEQSFKQFNPLEQKSIKLYTELLQKYLNQNLLKKCKSISENSQYRVQRLIERSSKEGLNEVEIAGKISKLGRVSIARAALIARTETFAAMNYGQIESARYYAQEFQTKTYKVWAQVNDNRSRETHNEIEGEEKELNEDFTIIDTKGNSYDCEAPHDTSLPAGEVINCRCTLLFRNEI